MKESKPTTPHGPDTGAQHKPVPGLEIFARAMIEAGGNRTRLERDGTETALIRSVERVNLLLERWHAMYDEQCKKNQPRLALINALALCAESMVPLPNWVAWDIRDAAHLLLSDGVPLNESLHVERLGKGRQDDNVLYNEQNALRLRFEVSCLIGSGKCGTKTAALRALANTPAFDNKSLSTLKRMMKMADQNAAMTEHVLKGVVKRQHRL